MITRVPAIEYRALETTEERRFDPYVLGIIGGGTLLSVAVWALAIAKVVEMVEMLGPH